jgi:CRISPR-associated protein Cas1
MPAVVTSENLTLKQLRGFEGRLVKSTYRNLVSKYRLHGWKRDPSSPDPVNIGLNVGNSILYAIALSACSAIAINPGLGIIHHGTTAALLYDLADLHKISVTIPAAFAVHASDEPARAVRLTVRDRAHKMNLSSVYLKFLTDLLTPHLQAASDDDFILDDDGKLVPGHKNWALE